MCDYTVSNQDLENLSFKRSYMGDGKFLYKKMDGTKEVCVLVEPELGKETELNVSFDKAEEHGMRDGLIIETGAMDDGYWAGDENPFHITVIGNGEEKEIERLENIVIDVQVAIDSKEWEHALRIADSIDYQRYDTEMERKWDIEREYWTDEVIEKAKMKELFWSIHHLRILIMPMMILADPMIEVDL